MIETRKSGPQTQWAATTNADLVTDVGEKWVYSGANNLRRWQAHFSETILTAQGRQRFL